MLKCGSIWSNGTLWMISDGKLLELRSKRSPLTAVIQLTAINLLKHILKWIIHFRKSIDTYRIKPLIDLTAFNPVLVHHKFDEKQKKW